MSHFETPEQRQIRQLQTKVEISERILLTAAAETEKYRKEMEKIRAQQLRETQRMEEEIRRQQEIREKERREFSAELAGLDAAMEERERLQAEKIRRMEINHQNQIGRMKEEFSREQEELRGEIYQTRREVRRGLEEVRRENDRKLQEQKEETQRELITLQTSLQTEIHSLDQKVNNLARQIAAQQNGDRELAVYWYQEALRLVEQLRETEHPQLLEARGLRNVDIKISSANSDIKGGHYQSAITAGREAFYDAMDMKENLVQAQLEWNYWFNAVKMRESGLLEAMNSAERRIYRVKTEDGVIEYDNGLDYWTNGQLSQARQQMEEARAGLAQMDGMTLAELQAAEANLRSVMEQLVLVENAGHINVAMAVSRYDTAAKIGSILDEGYEMTESDGEYFATEDREEYHAIFQNPNTGDQVAVVITPIAGEDGLVSNHIELLVGNADNDPVTRDRIAHVVAEELRSGGVEGCSFPCASRFGDHTAEEVARVGDIHAVEMGKEKARASLPAEIDPAKNPLAGVERRMKPAS